ncbi:hypothetical protein OESDEN_03897, partial [Oesophagostomum dentatum]
ETANDEELVIVDEPIEAEFGDGACSSDFIPSGSGKNGVGRFHDEMPEAKKRKKCSNMHPAETELLFKLVARDFSEYNKKFKSGSMLIGSKTGKTPRQKLHEVWANEVSALGISSRSADQIAEKVRKGNDKTRKAISTDNQRMRGTGGGTGPPPVELPLHLEPLREVMLGEHNVAGIPGVSDDEDNNFGTQKEVPAMQIRDVSPERCTSTPAAEAEEVVVPIYSGKTTTGKVREATSLAEMRIRLLQTEIEGAEAKKKYYELKSLLVQKQLAALQDCHAPTATRSSF